MSEPNRKTIAITIEETLTEEGSIKQHNNFAVNNMSTFEAIGLLRYYEKELMVRLLEQPSDPS
jgi:hypothetical protein